MQSDVNTINAIDNKTLNNCKFLLPQATLDATCLSQLRYHLQLSQGRLSRLNQELQGLESATEHHIDKYGQQLQCDFYSQSQRRVLFSHGDALSGQAEHVAAQNTLQQDGTAAALGSAAATNGVQKQHSCNGAAAANLAPEADTAGAAQRATAAGG